MGQSIRNLALYFQGNHRVTVEKEPIPSPGPGEVLVQTIHSAISAGTEGLFYRGEVPANLPIDPNIPDLKGTIHFPLKYGYAAVGNIIAVGKEVPKERVGQRIFCFHPHESYFTVQAKDVYPVPDDIASEDAIFLPNMETAVTLALDGAPRIGEKVVIIGLGVVGLLVGSLLSRFPLSRLLALERFPRRCEAGKRLGIPNCFHPEKASAQSEWHNLLDFDSPKGGADLVFELSGNPEALNLAIALSGFASRIVVGSWYGTKRADLNLGGKFHRNRLKLISSQVSTLSPELTGRWDSARRFSEVWRWIRTIRPSQFITHRFALSEAAQAYSFLENHPDEAIQVIFDYSKA